MTTRSSGHKNITCYTKQDGSISYYPMFSKRTIGTFTDFDEAVKALELARKNKIERVENNKKKEKTMSREILYPALKGSGIIKSQKKDGSVAFIVIVRNRRKTFNTLDEAKAFKSLISPDYLSKVKSLHPNIPHVSYFKKYFYLDEKGDLCKKEITINDIKNKLALGQWNASKNRAVNLLNSTEIPYYGRVYNRLIYHIIRENNSEKGILAYVKYLETHRGNRDYSKTAKPEVIKRLPIATAKKPIRVKAPIINHDDFYIDYMGLSKTASNHDLMLGCSIYG